MIAVATVVPLLAVPVVLLPADLAVTMAVDASTVETTAVSAPLAVSHFCLNFPKRAFNSMPFCPLQTLKSHAVVPATTIHVRFKNYFLSILVLFLRDLIDLFFYFLVQENTTEDIVK